MCVRRLGALGTGCNPNGLEVRASLTSPQRHPNWIFDKNAPFYRRNMCISGGFFWRPLLRENPSPPFVWNATLLSTVIACLREGGRRAQGPGKHFPPYPLWE